MVVVVVVAVVVASVLCFYCCIYSCALVIQHEYHLQASDFSREVNLITRELTILVLLGNRRHFSSVLFESWIQSSHGVS